MDLARHAVWITDREAYYPVRKAASSSIQHAFGGRPVKRHKVPKGVLRFTWVRNPFDRFASLFANNLDYYPLTESGIHKGMSFDDFILKVSQTREPRCDHHLWGAYYTTPKNCEVFYFEDFENELIRLRRYLGRDIPVKHIGKARGPKPEYTPELEALIAERYHEDLIRFYENHQTQRSCRAGGKTAARLRQQITGGVSGVHQE
jgi:hypothetical protein